MQKKIMILFVGLVVGGIMALPADAVITLDWSVTTGSIAQSGNMRQPAYNPITGHMLQIQSDTTIWILNAENGAVLGQLPRPVNGYGGAPSPYGIAVDANGVIYAVDDFWGTGPGGGNARILRWANETSTPTNAGSCGLTQVRSLRLIGTGVNTKLSFPNTSYPSARIFTTTNGTTFTLAEEIYHNEATHDAVLSPDGNVLWIATASGSGYTRRFVKSTTGTWSEDTLFLKSNWISSLAYSTRGKLYGAYWNTTPGVVDGIRVWDATSGQLLEQYDLGDTNEDARGGYISVYNAPNPLDDKLYFAFAGGLGYGRFSIPSTPILTVSPPSAVLTVGQKKKFSFSGVPGPVTWSSSNLSIGTADNLGYFYALSTGNCQMIATYAWGTEMVSGFAAVTVNPASAMLIPEAEATISKNAMVTLNVPEVPANLAWRKLEFAEIKD
ncbi:MAG: hypothetical protein N3A72_12050 [bacterium]|nr:hypothetical protein [bacterium]